MDKSKVQASSYATYSKYLILGFIGIVTSPMLIKYFSPEDYGTFHMVYSINTVIVYLSSFGLASVFVRYIPEFIETNFANGILKLTIGGILVRIGAVSIILLMAFIFSDVIQNYFSFTSFLREYYLLVLVFVFFTKIDETLGPMILGAYMEQVKLSIIQIIQAIIRLTVVLFCISNGLGLAELFMGLLGNEILISILFFIVVLQITSNTIKTLPEKRVSHFPLKRIGKFGSYSFLLSSTGVFRDVMVDNFVISHFLTMAHLGVYGFSYTILNILARFNPSMILKNQINHLIVRRHVGHGGNNVFLQSHRLTSSVSLSYLMPVLGYAVYNRSGIITLLNTKYEEANTLVLILSLMIIANGVQYSYGFIFSALEKMQYRFYSNIFSLYNLIADIILIQYYGLVGIAIATTSAAIFTTCYFHYIVTRKLNIKLAYYIPGIIKILIYIFISLFISNIPTVVGYPHIVFSAALFFVCYAVLFILKPPLHPNDEMIIRKLIWK